MATAATYSILRRCNVVYRATSKLKLPRHAGSGLTCGTGPKLTYQYARRCSRPSSVDRVVHCRRFVHSPLLCRGVRWEQNGDDHREKQHGGRKQTYQRKGRFHIVGAVAGAVLSMLFLQNDNVSAEERGEQSQPGKTAAAAAAEEEDKSHILPDDVIRTEIGRHERRTEIVPTTVGSPVEEIHSNWFAANRPCEDTFQCVPSLFNLYGVPGSMFGVFDGHSGGAASAFCRDHLIPAVFDDYMRRCEAGNTPKRHVPVLVADSFKAADEHFLTSCLAESPQDGLSGACVVMAHVDPAYITAAWAGDCRAVVGRVSPESPSGWKAIELTQDHQIDTHPGERARLLREHPDEPDVLYHDRVKGRLQPTRGFGDGVYKMEEYYQYIPRVHYRYETTGWKPPYTTVEAEVTRHRIESGDTFVVLATDGLFQDLTSQQVVDYMGQYMATHRPARVFSKGDSMVHEYLSNADANANSHSSSQSASAGPVLEPELPVPDNAASFLVQRALHHASIAAIDRMNSRYRTGIVLPKYSEREHLTAMLSMNGRSRRNVHDDISVLVVFLDSSPAMLSQLERTMASYTSTGHGKSVEYDAHAIARRQSSTNAAHDDESGTLPSPSSAPAQLSSRL